MDTLAAENESLITSAHRALGLLWVILLGFRYRVASDGEVATIRDLCDRLEPGVPRCQEYNEGVRQVATEARELCRTREVLPPHEQVERLGAQIDRLQVLLREYLPVVLRQAGRASQSMATGSVGSSRGRGTSGETRHGRDRR